MTMNEPRRRGRPPKPGGPIPRLTIRMKPEQRRRVEASMLPGETLSDTIRRLLDAGMRAEGQR